MNPSLTPIAIAANSAADSARAANQPLAVWLARKCASALAAGHRGRRGS